MRARKVEYARAVVGRRGMDIQLYVKYSALLRVFAIIWKRHVHNQITTGILQMWIMRKLCIDHIYRPETIELYDPTPRV